MVLDSENDWELVELEADAFVLSADGTSESRGSRIEDRVPRIEDRGSRIENRKSKIENLGILGDERGTHDTTTFVTKNNSI
jgi:hypothetical protein